MLLFGKSWLVRRLTCSNLVRSARACSLLTRAPWTLTAASLLWRLQLPKRAPILLESCCLVKFWFDCVCCAVFQMRYKPKQRSARPRLQSLQLTWKLSIRQRWIWLLLTYVAVRANAVCTHCIYCVAACLHRSVLPKSSSVNRAGSTRWMRLQQNARRFGRRKRLTAAAAAYSHIFCNTHRRYKIARKCGTRCLLVLLTSTWRI